MKKKVDKRLEKHRKEREGLCFITKYGESFVVIEFKGCHKVKIKFKNGYEKWVEWGNIKKDKVINPYTKTICKIGYIGEGKYEISINGEHTKAYQVWTSILQRCYDPYVLNKYPTYINCYVCEEWHNFQNFAEWFYKHYYEIKEQRMHLDKDILCKGNKIYSPETCIFVPERINYLFLKSDKKRNELPIGTDYHKVSRKIQVRCSVLKNGKKEREYLGLFPLNRPFQAFMVYKNYKEKYIKQVADEYKDLIPKELYEAMYKYEVEIND